MQNAAPDIRERGEGAITGSTYINNRLEISGAYSPVQHLLVRASYSGRLPDGSGAATDSTFYRGQQYDVGLGTYWNLNDHATLGALAGYGEGTSQSRFTETHLLGSPSYWNYALRYNKIFGEAYGIYRFNALFSLGFSYRITQVDFTSLTNYGRPIDITDMLRQEPMVAARFSFGGTPSSRPVQAQVASGLSFITLFDNRFPRIEREKELVIQQRVYTTLSLTIFPQRLIHWK